MFASRSRAMKTENIDGVQSLLRRCLSDSVTTNHLMESDRKLLTEIKNYESDHRPLTPLKLFWIVLHILERAEQVVIVL